MSLVRENSVALYRQIADLLRAEIGAGAFEPSGRLPSEAEIGARFGVSRVTVRLALDDLEREALIDRRKGKGTFVAGRQVRHRIDALRSFHESLTMQGLDAAMQVVELARAESPENLREALGPHCALMERLHLVGGEPIAFARSFLPLAIASLDRGEAERQPVYALLNDPSRGGLARADIAIGAHAADTRISSLLGAADGAVFLVMERTSFFGDGGVAERSEFFIRPERYRFVLGSGPAASPA